MSCAVHLMKPPYGYDRSDEAKLRGKDWRSEPDGRSGWKTGMYPIPGKRVAIVVEDENGGVQFQWDDATAPYVELALHIFGDEILAMVDGALSLKRSHAAASDKITRDFFLTSLLEEGCQEHVDLYDFDILLPSPQPTGRINIKLERDLIDRLWTKYLLSDGVSAEDLTFHEKFCAFLNGRIYMALMHREGW